MTIINPNSISGITSVTASGGDITYYKSDGTRGNQFTHNVSSTGVITATKFVGSFDGTTVSGSTGAFSGDVTISGNLGVAGTVTYEDVARVDATGISTFREGFGVGPLAGIALTAYADGSIRTSGIITATTFGSDTNSIFTTGGTERARITSAGRMGIGEASPDTLLHINGGTSNNVLKLESTDGTCSMEFYDNATTDGNQPIIGAVGNNFYAETGGSERLRINSSGHVGINETSPNRLLYISDDSNTAYSNTGGSNGAVLRLHNKNGTDNSGVNNQVGIEMYVANGATSVGMLSMVRTGNNEGDLTYKSRTGASSYAEHIRITSNGAVGIGTVNPDNMCDNRAGLHIHSTHNDSCRLNLTTPNKPNTRIGYFGLNRFGIDAHNGFEIRDPSASYATRFLINNNGIITKPNIPCFSAYINNNTNRTNTGAQTLPFDSTRVNNGNHFNTSNHRFVAPVTGFYYFHLSLNTSGRVEAYIDKNGSGYVGAENEVTGQDGVWKHVNVSCVMQLNASQYASCRVNQQASGQNAWNSGSWDDFSGWLIG